MLKCYHFVKKAKKALSKLTSYRPISLTCSLSKVYEIILDKSITHLCRVNNTIPDTQFGFQPQLSTVHAINRVIDNISSHLHRNEIVAACLIDIEKAFDSVWINGLLFKLIKKKFPVELVDLIYDMIKDKQFVTFDGKNLSSLKFIIEEGLHQGTVNSPALYNSAHMKSLIYFIKTLMTMKHP